MAFYEMRYAGNDIRLSLIACCRSRSLFLTSGEQVCFKLQRAEVAQSVEQGTENPRVTGSIPVLGTFLISDIPRSKSD